MSLRDDLNSVVMNQTDEYKEETQDGTPDNNSNPNLKNNRRSKDNPFKGLIADKIKPSYIVIGIVIVIIVIVVAVFIPKTPNVSGDGITLDNGIEENTFKYNMDERDLLRNYGFTADDIDRLEVEETNPNAAVEEVISNRKEINDAELKPYLDGASDQFKKLKDMTWIGTGTMSPSVFSAVEGEFEQYSGTYNCDYVKVTPMGVQLFLKVILADFNNQAVFMMVNPELYNKLSDSGNLVVEIEFNQYTDGKILVTNISEKAIE